MGRTCGPLRSVDGGLATARRALDAPARQQPLGATAIALPSFTVACTCLIAWCALRPGRKPKRTTVSLSATQQGDHVSISVADQGSGIAPGEQRKIFERFYRVGRDPSVREEGTGIGLALVKEIVSQHDGRIEVDSREGGGSRFTIVLPAKSQ